MHYGNKTLIQFTRQVRARIIITPFTICKVYFISIIGIQHQEIALRHM